MNISNSAESPLSNDSRPLLQLDQPLLSNQAVQTSQRDQTSHEMLYINSRLLFIDNLLRSKSPSNRLFWVLLWIGLFFGVTVSLYLTLVRDDHRSLGILLPFLIIAAYYQIFYFLFGIYANERKQYSITSMFNFLSIANIIVLCVFEVVFLIDVINYDNSMNTVTYNKMLNQLAAPTLISIPSELAIVIFITYKTNNFLKLLKEKEDLEIRKMQVRLIGHHPH